MRFKFLSLLFVLSVFLVISGCSDETASNETIPDAVAMTEEAVGHYCNMSILEHQGPKAQMHLKGFEHPIWFSQVRDAIAYTRLPEETNKAIAIYVHDMSKAASWEHPGDDAWIDINKAYFVIESKKVGGMGTPETIPFGTKEKAMEFATTYGGGVVQVTDIPDSYVLAPVDINPQITGSTE